VDFVRDHNLNGIEFVGEVSQAELPHYYKSCDVFCAPALSGESFGMVLIEAMAVGRPVVATRIDGYSQVMQDGVQGRLVEPRDSHGLAMALIEVLCSEQARQSYGEHGRLTAKAFSWERVSMRLIRFYQDVQSESATGVRDWMSSLEIQTPWFTDQTADSAESAGLSEGATP
jgi:phosphatidylinositol alpha-mannosyltransferase